jgi:hypothetical protein
MSSTILFRFQSAKKNDAITFSGLMIRLLELKRAIVDKKQLARGHLDFDLAVSNAQTNEGHSFYSSNHENNNEQREIIIAKELFTLSNNLSHAILFFYSDDDDDAPITSKLY